MRPLTSRRLLLVTALLALVLLAVTAISLKLGAVHISITDLTVALFRKALGWSDTLPTEFSVIVFGLRLPRIILGALVGAALSVAGAGFQALLRNPLADPYVLGISSGAALGAIVSLTWSAAAIATPFAAFAGAGAAMAVVYFLGRREGQLDSYTLLLAGIIVASFLSALIIFLMRYLTGIGESRGMAFWLMGDLSTPPSIPLTLVFFGFLLGFGAIYTTARDLNLLLTGEQEAMHLGVDVTRVKLVVYISASLLTGLAVSVSGAIGYVGLLAPHIMRMLFGSDYRLLLPASALGGAIVVVVADTLARTIVAPTEISVGAMTAMAGAPVFLFLLRRRLQ